MFAGGVAQRYELVHLEERPRWLGRLDPHPLSASGVAVQVSVLHGLVEDRREGVDELLDRRRAKRTLAPPGAATDDRSCGKRRAELRNLLELRGLEALAQLSVDLVDGRGPKEREQVPSQAPEVVGLGVGVDRAVPDHPVLLGLKPVRRVFVERGRLGGPRRGGLPAAPDADLDLGQDVVELDAGRGLGPPAAASAPAPFVEDLALADAGDAKTQVKRSRAVDERLWREAAVVGRAMAFPPRWSGAGSLRVVRDQLDRPVT